MDDIEWGKLINSVENIEKEQIFFRKEQKKISEKTNEMFIVYQDQKQLRLKIQTVWIKKIADFAQYIWTAAIVAYLYVKG